MLISFTVGNYRSFGDEQTLSLEAVKDNTHSDHVVNRGNFSLLKSVAIYGSNASGKSNLLKAFEFMADFVRSSATGMNLGDPIRGADRFRLDKARSDMPCSFDIRVLLNETEYQYGFSASMERVHDEWLYVTRKGMRSTNPLSRRFDPSSDKTDWKLRGELKGSHDLIEKTRDNGLFLSRAAEMNVGFVKELFLWFTKRMRYWHLAEWPAAALIQLTARRIERSDSIRARIERLIHDADFGIDGLSTSKESIFGSVEDISEEARKVSGYLEDGSEETRKFSRDIREWVESVALRNERGVGDALNKFTVRTLHRIPNCEDSVAFSLETDESDGTRRFFGVIGTILEALDDAGLLIVDELDCSIHPQLTRKLVEMFHSEEANPKGAQLLFATHDTNLMTPSLFRRDQIWLTEKTQKGNTEIFSLSDIESDRRPRKEEPFEKNYLAGRYGGVPSFGPALEDFGVQ
jgi:uncharacterized protein